MTHLSSPNYHGHVEMGTSAASVAADQLMAALTSPAPTWMVNPSSTELEMRTTDWLGRMMGLPEEFLFSSGKGNGGGVIQDSASGSCILMLVAAKARAIQRLRKNDPDLDPYDVVPKLVAFTSDQAHSSVARSGRVAGIRFEILPSDEEGSIRAVALQEAVEEAREKGRIPIFLGATLGTTTSCAFDKLSELGPICEMERIWLHVDSAIAGTAFICPEFRHLMKGIEYVDSFNCGPHKTMLVSMNCSVLWVKDRLTVEGSLAVDPPYLHYEVNRPRVDYMHWSVNLCRPFRSLKLWFVMRLYGVQGLRKEVRKRVRLLNEFADLVREDGRFEICARVVYSVVCFRLKGADNKTNSELLTRVNQSERVFLSSSIFKGNFVLRFAVCNAVTESGHVTAAWEEVRRATSEMLQAKYGNGLILM